MNVPDHVKSLIIACLVIAACAVGHIVSVPTARASGIAGMSVFLDPGHSGINDSSMTKQVPNGRGGTKDCQASGTATDDGYPEHTFTWDNVGFDGISPYRVLAFDAPDSFITSHQVGAVGLGYPLPPPTILEVPGVYWLQQPTAATVTFNWFAEQPLVPDVRINGGPWHSTPWPFDQQAFSWRTFAVPIPVGEIRPGTNAIEFRSGAQTIVANVDIVLTAASPVP